MKCDISRTFFCLGITHFALPNLVLHLWGEQNVGTTGYVDNYVEKLWITLDKKFGITLVIYYLCVVKQLINLNK